ncbi:MAG: cyclic lactone autoinducer peptide [Firmicutes bacterium]|nr:cyclic lactone autoinducer peptide [Bacillota bacterium]
MKKLGVSLIIFLCTVLAMLSIGSACSWWVYQPEPPQRLHN